MRSNRRSKKGKMDRSNLGDLIRETEELRRQIHGMERSIGQPISVSRSRSSSPSQSPRPKVVQGRRVSPSPVSSERVASPRVATPRASTTRSTSPRTPSSMKKGRRRSVVEDLPGIDARTRAQYYNSLSAKERSEKGLYTTEDYNEQWISEHPLGALSTPVHEAYAKARRRVKTGEPGSTPGMKVGIPGRTGREQKYRKGSYDTLGTVPPLTEAERQGLMEAAKKASGKNKLPMMEEKAGGASRSKSPVHTRDSSEFSDDFIEKVYYYSETYRDWLNAELIIDGDNLKMRIITPDAGPRYIFGNLTDSVFKQQMRGKIYIRENRSYKLHPIKDRLNK
jgi:hypothetical protein